MNPSLLAILVVSCLLSAFLCVRLRPFAHCGADKQPAAFSHHPVVPVLAAPVHVHTKAKSKSCFYS